MWVANLCHKLHIHVTELLGNVERKDDRHVLPGVPYGKSGCRTISRERTATCVSGCMHISSHPYLISHPTYVGRLHLHETNQRSRLWWSVPSMCIPRLNCATRPADVGTYAHGQSTQKRVSIMKIPTGSVRRVPELLSQEQSCHVVCGGRRTDRKGGKIAATWVKCAAASRE